MSVKKNTPGDSDLPFKKKKGQNTSVTKAEKAAIEELFRNAISEYSVKFQTKQIERTELVSKISSFISEFLSAFIIIGYDMKGSPINVIHGSSQMDIDALTAALNKFIFNIHNNND